MSIIEQLARFLAGKLQLPLEGDTDGAVFYGYMPEKPTKAICVYANDLRAPGDDEGTRVQIVVRSDMDGGWALAQSLSIMSILDDARDLIFVRDGAYIPRIETEKGFQFSGMAGNNTQFYAANFRIYYCGGY
jgi:hypothetical protein